MKKEPNPVQDLYDRACQHYRKRELEGARPLVLEALETAPEDLELHLLAGHIDWHEPEGARHFEYILDRNIHFRDSLYPEDPHHFVDLLTTHYGLELLGPLKPIDAECLATYERYAHYFGSLLQAGRPISSFAQYLGKPRGSREGDRGRLSGRIERTDLYSGALRHRSDGSGARGSHPARRGA